MTEKLSGKPVSKVTEQ